MIRAVTERDLTMVITLLKQLSPYPVSPDPDMVRAKIREIEACDHVRVFGFERDGRIVGMCTVGRIEGLSKDCRPFAVIENVVVHESMRRQGIGTELVCHAISQADSCGMEADKGSRQYNSFYLKPAATAFRLQHPLTLAELRSTGCDPECFGPGTAGRVFPLTKEEFLGIIKATARVNPDQSEELTAWVQKASAGE